MIRIQETVRNQNKDRSNNSIRTWRG